jgi:hypothetical protein
MSSYPVQQGEPIAQSRPSLAQVSAPGERLLAAIKPIAVRRSHPASSRFRGRSGQDGRLSPNAASVPQRPKSDRAGIRVQRAGGFLT